jgi:hypothetical protein
LASNDFPVLALYADETLPKIIPTPVPFAVQCASLPEGAHEAAAQADGNMGPDPEVPVKWK